MLIESELANIYGEIWQKNRFGLRRKLCNERGLLLEGFYCRTTSGKMIIYHEIIDEYIPSD